MEVRRLRYFAVLAEELNFRRAAQRLHIAQPALSQQMRVLERELGVRLFERDNRGATLTPAGRALVEEGVPWLHELDRIVARVRGAAQGRTGLLRVVHSRSLIAGTPDRIVGEFQGRWPGVELQVETAWTARNVEMVRGGLADVAFVRLPMRAEADLRVMRLGRTEMAAVLPSGHPLTRRRAVRFADLAGEPIVCWPRMQAPEYFDYLMGRVWGTAGPRRITFEPDPEHILASVASGAGIAVLGDDRVGRLRPKGVAWRRFTAPALHAEFGVVWSAARVPDAVAGFIQVCTELAEPDPVADDTTR